MQNRQILDNVILVQEALHSSKESEERGIVIKLDMANAFDRVRHAFLFAVMEKMGFNNDILNWIQALHKLSMDHFVGQWKTDQILPSHKGVTSRFPTLSSALYNNG